MTTFAQPTADAPPPVGHPTQADLIAVVRAADANAPRSQQRNLGPSECWMECLRRQAYRLLDWPKVNTLADPWAAILGTATHAWLADAFTADNHRLGRTRWAVEKRLEIRTGLAGSCDLYDLDTRRVIDHKVVGATTMRRTQREGPSEGYRRQAHLYGLGWDRLGLPPTEVCLAFYPRGGFLGGLHVWSEPYDPALAHEALDRLDNVLIACDVLDIDGDPERFGEITAAPSHACNWCPWFSARATNFADGCRGHLAAAAADGKNAMTHNIDRSTSP